MIAATLTWGPNAFLLLSGPRLGTLLRVLVGNAFAALVVLFGVCGRPPIAEVAVSVELAALIVESVREFVTDNHADGAIIYGIVHTLLKERRLQNAGGKVDGVQLRIVVGVDGGRRHGPLAAIHGFADLGHPALELERRGLSHIREITLARDLHAGVIAPVRGIADLIFDSFQLDNSLFLGRRRHPGHSLNVILHGLLDAMHHLKRSRLALRRKSAVHVSLPEHFPQIAVGCSTPTSPSRKLAP